MFKITGELLSDDPRYDPNNLFDTIKSKFQIEKDSTLAELLKIDRVRISKMRSKLIPVSANLLVRIHDLVGISLADLRQLMVSSSTKPKIKNLKIAIKLPVVESKSRARYTAAFKIKAVRMISETHPCARVAKELNLPAQTLHNWWVAHRSGNLLTAVWLNAEEIGYVQTVLKKYAAELRKSASEPQSRQEKKFLVELQKKLHISD